MNFQHASLIRRCGAILYDSLIVLALLMLGTWLTLPLTQGEPISPGNVFYQVYLLMIVLGYYLGFWVHGGQTVGMRAWKIKVVTAAGLGLTWRLALIRLGFAALTLLPAGFGLWFALFNRERQTVYDRLAGTRVVRVDNY